MNRDETGHGNDIIKKPTTEMVGREDHWDRCYLVQLRRCTSQLIMRSLLR